MASNAIDLATFKPGSAKELLDGVVAAVVPVFGAQWKQARKEMTAHFKAVTDAAHNTQQALLHGQITAKDADFLLHMQELYLNNVLRYAAFLTYAMAQSILDAVFEVIGAAIKNVTGVKLNF